MIDNVAGSFYSTAGFPQCGLQLKQIYERPTGFILHTTGEYVADL